MTSDAKVGLLLGLVFIVIIAFLINGLPNLLAKDGDSNTFRSTIPNANAFIVLDDQADRAIRELENMGIEEPIEPRQVDISGNNGDPRFSDEPLVADNSGRQRVSQNVPRSNRPLQATAKKYTVKSGDNLATIAKRIYGPQQGNRHVIVQRLFQANKATLSSPDDIYVGQKLIVPSLSSQTAPASTSESTAMDRVEQTGMFERARSLFRGSGKRSEAKVYVVKSNDSLWQIANKCLGDGNRYSEIVGLNNIPDGETIFEGMRLKLPKR